MCRGTLAPQRQEYTLEHLIWDWVCVWSVANIKDTSVEPKTMKT